MMNGLLFRVHGIIKKGAHKKMKKNNLVIIGIIIALVFFMNQEKKESGEIETYYSTTSTINNFGGSDCDGTGIASFWNYGSGDESNAVTYFGNLQDLLGPNKKIDSAKAWIRWTAYDDNVYHDVFTFTSTHPNECFNWGEFQEDSTTSFLISQSPISNSWRYYGNGTGVATTFLNRIQSAYDNNKSFGIVITPVNPHPEQTFYHQFSGSIGTYPPYIEIITSNACGEGTEVIFRTNAESDYEVGDWVAFDFSQDGGLEGLEVIQTNYPLSGNTPDCLIVDIFGYCLFYDYGYFWLAENISEDPPIMIAHAKLSGNATEAETSSFPTQPYCDNNQEICGLGVNCNTDADGMYDGSCDGCVDSNEWISNGALDSWYYQSVDPDNGKIIDNDEWPGVQSAWYYQEGCS